MDNPYFHGSQPYHQFMSVSPPTPSSSGLEDFDTSPAVSAPRHRCRLVTVGASYIGASLRHTVVAGAIRQLSSANQAILDDKQEPLHAHQYYTLSYGEGYGNSGADGISDSLIHPTPSGLEGPYAQMQRSGAPGTGPRKGKGDGGTSEDDNGLTPAQTRRKAQNRAAQQAFRKRKEDHIKDLKAKVTDLEAMQEQVLVENKRLRQDLQKVSTENEILRATSHLGSPPESSPESADLEIFTHGRFQSHSSRNKAGKSSRRVHDSKRLDSNATWEFIINHELFKKGLVDINDVSQRLKQHAQYDSRGPTFSERSINTVIAQSVASGTDDLL